jgi:hypothetical protein
MRLTMARLSDAVTASVVISRLEGDETLPLLPNGERGVLMSSDASAEPHEFTARLVLQVGDHQESLPFQMVEPPDHVH